jgi:hypothetical protein
LQLNKIAYIAYDILSTPKGSTHLEYRSSLHSGVASLRQALKLNFAAYQFAP